MKVKVDREACSSCGVCAETCPKVFTMDDEEIAVAVQGTVPVDLEQDVREAAEDCPVEAIKIEEE